MGTEVCCVKGCKFSCPENVKKVSLFSLPKDENLRKKWMESIPNDLSGLKCPRICEDHFLLEDIVRIPKVESEEKVKRGLKRPLLRGNAVPTIFSVPSDIDPKKSDEALPHKRTKKKSDDCTTSLVLGTGTRASTGRTGLLLLYQPVLGAVSPTPPKKSRTDVNEVSTPTLQESPISKDPNVYEELQTLKKNQAVLLQKQNEMTMSVLRQEKKLDYLITLLERKASPPEDNFNEFFGILPLTEKTFDYLEEKLSACSNSKEQLKVILLSSYGRDCKGFISCCLRKVLTDELACRFSLTGRDKTGTGKLSFEKTTLYAVVREVIFQNFTQIKENTIRDTVSDWLIQAKFRIARRGSREKNNLGREKPC